MMGKILKWVAIIMGVLIVLLLLAAGALILKTNSQLNKVHIVLAEKIVVPTDAASIERGNLWVHSECTHCHGSDLAGKVMIKDPMIGTIYSLNLTPGKGGAGEEFKDTDWVRAIRHGVNPEGHSLIVMPSSDFYNFSDSDLGDIIAYLKSLYPVDKETPDPAVRPFGKVLIGAGAFGKIIQADNINHSAVRPPVPAAGVTAEYGKYLVTVSGCFTCHGENLAGGQSAEPGAPPSPNLTMGGKLVAWSEADFINTLRTGVDPSNHKLTHFMPWKDYGQMTDSKLKAIWLYLQSLPAK
jgi:cytochrome c553